MKAAAYKEIGWRNHVNRVGKGGTVLQYETVAYDYYMIKTDTDEEIVVCVNSEDNEDWHFIAEKEIQRIQLDHVNEDAEYEEIKQTMQAYWNEIISFEVDNQGFYPKA